jgi:hypothetical protein
MQEEWSLKHICIAQPYNKKIKPGTVLSEAALLAQSGNSFYSYRQADGYFRCSIAIDERSGFVACNGYPGELQMIDASPIVRLTHQVLPYTRVSKKEAYTKMYVPSVSIFRFVSNASGAYMATVDVTRGQDTAVEASLKFWVWSMGKNKYKLSATVDRPHGSHRVTDLDFIPATGDSSNISCATCAVDGSVKVWQGKYVAVSHTTNQSNQIAKASSQHDSSSNGASSQQIKWNCAFSFTYREAPSYCVRSSFDGSILAVGHGNSVSLWDHSTVTMKHAFTSNSTAAIFFVRFIEPLARPAFGGGCGHCYLVLGSKESLQVYDLLTLELVWSIEGTFDCFAVAKNETYCLRINSAHNNGSAAGIVSQGWIVACKKEKVVNGKVSASAAEADKKSVSKRIVSFDALTPRISRV